MRTGESGHFTAACREPAPSLGMLSEHLPQGKVWKSRSPAARAS